MQLDSHSIYLQRTRNIPRLTKEQQIAFFISQADDHHQLINALCSDQPGLSCLHSALASYLSHNTRFEHERLTHFKSLEDSLKSETIPSPSLIRALFDFCYTPYTINKNGIKNAFLARYHLRSLSPIHYQAKAALNHVLQEEKNFFNANSRLVKYFAGTRRKDLDFMDKIQNGYIGIIEAIDRFDYTRNYAFSTYAAWWIRHEIQKHHSFNSGVRITPDTLRVLDNILKCQERLHRQFGSEPSIEQIAEYLELKPQTIQRYLGQKNSVSGRVLSFDQPCENGSSLLEQLSEQLSSLNHDILITPASLEKILSPLTPRERSAISLTYGLGGLELDTTQIASTLGISRQRVQQLCTSALTKIRYTLRHELHDYRGFATTTSPA